MPPNVGKTFGGIFLYIGWIECCNNERVKKNKESGTIPNSLSKYSVNNLSYFQGVLLLRYCGLYFNRISVIPTQ